MKLIFPIIISYLIGSFSGSYLIGMLFLNKDVRKYGSGNAGTTNALRVFGKKWGIITFLIDFFKGVLVVLIAKYAFKLDTQDILLCILFGVIGHDYPFYMNFKGGKGVATTLGTMAVFNFKLALICTIIWAISTYISKMVSFGSIMLFISVFFVFLFFGGYEFSSNIIILIISLLGIYRHKSNIIRIINKNERKIGEKKI